MSSFPVSHSTTNLAFSGYAPVSGDEFNIANPQKKVSKNADVSSLLANQTKAGPAKRKHSDTPELGEPKTKQDHNRLQIMFQRGDELSRPMAEEGNDFNICNIGSSYQMNLMSIQDVLIAVLQKGRESKTTMSMGLQEVAVGLAETSANNTIKAGEAAASGAVTMGIIGMGGATIGLGKSIKGYKQGKLGIEQQRNSLNFKGQADVLRGDLQRILPTGKMNQHELQADRAVITNGGIQKNEQRANQASIQANVHQNKVTKLNAQSMASTQMGNMGGQIASSPFQIEQANETALATLADNDKQVVEGTRNNIDESKRISAEIMQQLMNLLSGVLSEVANTSGDIASRMGGK